MRDIEFRGLNKSGEWIYGSYATDNKDYHAILMSNPDDDTEMLNHSVEPKTVGQYTGLKDCNGVKIFEGDVLSCYHFTDDNGVDHFIEHIVSWSGKFHGWFALNKDSINQDDGSIQLWNYMRVYHHTVKVIGNIHQNSDLL